MPANDWTLIDAPAAGDLEPAMSVSVLLDGAGEASGRSLTDAALAAQDYPAELVEVVEPGAEPGGDVVVVVGDGAMPGPGFLRAHARWHHAASDVATVAALRTIDVSGLDARAIEAAAGAGRLAELLGERQSDADDPFGLALDLTALLTDLQGGLFLAATLGSLAVSRGLYLAAGGPSGSQSPLGRLDLAYRIACAGAVFVPEPDAAAPAAGGREAARLAGSICAAATEGPPLAAERPDAAALVPLPPFRATGGARRHRRPVAVVNVAAAEASGEEVVATAEQVLGGRFGDIELRVEVGESHPDRERIVTALERDPRAVLARPSTAEPCRSPVQILLPALALPDPRTIGDLVTLLATEDAGALHVTVPGAPPDETMIEVVSTAALERARRLAASTGEEVEPVLARLYGERWISGVEVSVRRHGVEEPHVTEHGPLAAATDLDHERTQHLRFRDRADDLEQRTASQEQRILAERLRTRSERLRAEQLEARLRERR